MLQNRRTFLTTIAGLASTAMLANRQASSMKLPPDSLHIASNQYPWFTFYQRQGRNWTDNLDASLQEFRQSGIIGYEPSVVSPQEIELLAPLLKKHSLEMRSIYVNSVLHEADEINKSVKSITAIGDAAKSLGLKIIVTNPNPIKWGGPEDKTDKQLDLQANALNRLGEELTKRGLILAYHTHDIEMRNAAREFHHMMLATEPKNVSLCLDAHWIYRGSGNSQIALFDVIRLYGKRISELHLRQSKDGIWTETLGEGDIDYKRLVEELRKTGVNPHIVLEQAVEKGSPQTLNALEAHKQSLAYTKTLFSAFAKK